MKAKLEFNLPEENEDLELAINGPSWKLVAWEIDQRLRAKMKYDDSISEECYELCASIRGELREVMDDNNVSFDN